MESGPWSLRREARHLALPALGEQGVASIASATVLVIGAGGTGCAAAASLGASGVGRLVISDFDAVDVTNLARQVFYHPGDVGRAKVDIAARRICDQNPAVDVVALNERLVGEALLARVREADIVLDCSDNFATRFAINDACVETGSTLVVGAAIRLEGQVAVFGPDFSESPCYRCLYSEADESLENCAGNGVLGPVPGVVGTLMAVEALKAISGVGTPTRGLLIYDAGSGDFRHLGISKRPNCPACGRGSR